MPPCWNYILQINILFNNYTWPKCIPTNDSWKESFLEMSAIVRNKLFIKLDKPNNSIKHTFSDTFYVVNLLTKQHDKNLNVNFTVNFPQHLVVIFFNPTNDCVDENYPFNHTIFEVTVAKHFELVLLRILFLMDKWK